MALRKPVKHISSDSQQVDENSQEDDSATDTGDELSSFLLSTSSRREKRWRERENKVKQKAVNSEMSEDEMMDLALRLSEREASASALQQQQEEEAVMKAIQESMVSQTQPCLSSTSKTLLADASHRLGSRRKLLYSNRVSVSATNQGGPEDCSTTEFDLKSEAKGAEDEKIPCNRKRKRKAGSPLLEMPDLSQSQKVSSQNSPCSFEPFSAPLDSPQSSDSTQIDDFQLQKSPVFPLTGCRVAVHIDRLSQNLVESCRNSGFVLCSQDSWTLTEPESPTFPQSNPRSCPKSPVFSGTRPVEQSPAFGRDAQHETSPSACRLHHSENPEFVFSSQGSLSPSARSCGSKSPVFLRSPQNPKILPPSDGLPFHKSLDPEQVEENNEPYLSPVFGKTEPQRRSLSDEQKMSAGPSVSERRGSDCEEQLDRKEKTKSDGCQVDELTVCPASEKPNKKSKDWSSAETELSSDMMLVWTDEDEDDNTLDGSPSPVFPEEKPLHQADGQAALLTHDPAASQENTRKQLPTTEEETRPISRQQEDRRVSPSPGQSSGGPTVHYYWGVPFCPQGLDPDTYTQVILAQMEVYQTSLKRAQRGLLRKAEWGEAVLPQPEKSPSPEVLTKSPQLQVPRRKGLRLRARKRNEAAESAAEEEERKEEENKKQEKEEEEINKSDEEQMDTDDCDVCPETQLSNEDTQDQTMVTDAEAQFSSQSPPKSPELPEAKTVLQHGSVRDEPQEEEEEEEEEEIDAHAETKGNVSGCGGDAGGRAVGEETEATKDGRDPDVEKKKSRGLRRSASPEQELAVVPRSPDASVDCPICQASFPVSEIELHAAYCDGEVAVVGERRPGGDRFQESVRLRRKRTRRAEAEGRNDSDVCSNQEMCYICRKAVPLREYSRHTEFCLQSRTRHRANLLSALERTESRDSEAGPSGSRVQPEAVIDLRDEDNDNDDDDDEAASAFRISDSPIRSFTCISEASNCLIDFKKQHQTKKPSHRRR